MGVDAGRGPRPGRRRRRLRVHAHDRRARSASTSSTAASTTSSSTPRRSAPTPPSACPASCGRGEAGNVGHRQRARRRRRRRQGRLRLGARHHPLLPRRGAAHPERADLPLPGTPTSGEFVIDNIGELVVKPANESGGYGMLIGNRATAEERADRIAGHRGRSPQLGGAADPRPVDGADAHRRRRSSPATSTCGRSSSPVRTSYVTKGGLTRVALPRGLTRRELVPGRRQQGHLGRRSDAPPTTERRLMLLSRVAENLYWSARYLERAEDTARIVREHTNLLVDLPDDGAPVTWEPLLAIIGDRADFDASYPARRRSVDRALPRGRPEQPGQHPHAASSTPARTCARRREVLPAGGVAGRERPLPLRRRQPPRRRRPAQPVAASSNGSSASAQRIVGILTAR